MAHSNNVMLDMLSTFIDECTKAGYTQDADFDASKPEVQAIAVKYADFIKMTEIGRHPKANVLRSMMWNVCTRSITMHATLLKIPSSK